MPSTAACSSARRSDRVDVFAAHVLHDLVEQLVLRLAARRVDRAAAAATGRGQRAAAAQQHEARTDGGAGQQGKDGSDWLVTAAGPNWVTAPDITQRGWR